MNKMGVMLKRGDDNNCEPERVVNILQPAKIYIFNNGGSFGWYQACALSSDGIPLCNHICSSEEWMKHDMGVEGSTWKHEIYNAFAPQGWEPEFVPYDSVAGNEGLQRAFKLAEERQTKADHSEKVDGVCK